MLNSRVIHLSSILFLAFVIPLISTQRHGLPSTKLHLTPDDTRNLQSFEFTDEFEENINHVRKKRAEPQIRNITTNVSSFF